MKARITIEIDLPDHYVADESEGGNGLTKENLWRDIIDSSGNQQIIHATEVYDSVYAKYMTDAEKKTMSTEYRETGWAFKNANFSIKLTK